MESLEWHTARAMLAWQVEMGVDEALSDAPVDRFALQEAVRTANAALPPKSPTPVKTQAMAKEPAFDAVADAQTAADQARSLPELRAAMDAYPHCELRKGARNLVFSDGAPQARVMLIGEAPGRDEDLAGKPFVGRAGQLLDRMLAAIALERAQSVYLTNVLPWRPPQNRDPRPDEIAMMQPFLRRHIALADPDLLVVIGNHACKALLGKTGITRLRGTWAEAEGRPALPMLHPDYLLRYPGAKREAWADLLSLQARLRALPPKDPSP